jgi:hypothetical protein
MEPQSSGNRRPSCRSPKVLASAACKAGYFCFAHDGNLILVTDGDTHVRAYDRKGKLLYTAEAGLLEPFDLSLSADGKAFPVAGAEGRSRCMTVQPAAMGLAIRRRSLQHGWMSGMRAEVLYRTVLELDGDANNANKKDRWSGYKPCCHGKRKGS